jgi:hypothetical protein
MRHTANNKGDLKAFQMCQQYSKFGFEALAAVGMNNYVLWDIVQFPLAEFNGISEEQRLQF